MAEFDVNSTYIPALHKPSALLPVAKHRESLLYLIETNPVTVVVGQTGSGKTTQIPQFLEAAGWCSDGKIIGVTQPRRVAATTVAVRVAEEFGCELGKQVGYSIRFEDVTSEATKIKFMTDGLLIREALVDPLLSRYAVIMVDEAHERSISTDVLLGLLKKIIRRRPELRIIISSATLQADEFLRFFSNGDAPDKRAGAIITLEGRTYPIDVLYREKAAEDYVQAAVSTVLDIHQKEAAGDILVFLTGREEIDSAIRALEDHSARLAAGSNQILALPLYAGLSTEQQMYVFEPAPLDTRKVILSTNIAEASVTIDGIVYVLDCGFAKLRAFNPQTCIESLTVTPISKASAQQRAGRAGRTRPGKCFRLYSEDAYNTMPEVTAPEIQRSNLAPFILQLKALGIDNVVRFDFFTPPPSELMLRATELLFSLGALDEYAKLTKPLGMRMAELAVEPMMAKTLLSSPSFDCVDEMLSIAAMTALGGSVFYSDDNKKQAEVSRRRFAAEEGDHITLLNIYQAFVTAGKKEPKFCHQNHLNYKSLSRAVSIRAQLRRYLERFGLISEVRPQVLSPSKAESIRRCLTAGYFAHAARMQADGSFLNVAGGTVLHAHPSSLMFNRRADWVIFHEVMESGSKTFIRDITKIEKSWLLEYAEGFYHIKE